MIRFMSPSQHDRALQDRATRLRERQQTQRAALVKVPAALARVDAVVARERAREEIERQAALLAELKRQAKELAASQRRELGGRALRSADEERDAAAAVIAEAVDAFGSRAAAAEGLGVPQRTVSEYVARNARTRGKDVGQALADDADPDDDQPSQHQLPLV